MHSVFLHRSSRVAAVVILAGAMLLALQVTRGHAIGTTRTWTGATDSNWGTASNWNPAGVPGQGDVLVFPGAAPLSTNNNLNGLDLDTLSFAANYVVTGNAFTVDTEIAVTNAVVSVANMVSVGADNMNFTVTGAASELNLGGTLNLGGHSPIFHGHGIIRTDDITGSGNVNMSGPGILEYHGMATYSGATTVGGGTLRAATDMANPCVISPGNLNRLPAGGEVLVSGGAVLDLQCPVVIGELDGGGEVRTESGTAILRVNANGDSQFSGSITGPGGLTVGDASHGTYGLTLSGTSTYTGPTVIDGGLLSLFNGSIASSSGATASGGGVAGGSGTYPALSLTSALLYPGINGLPGELKAPSLIMTSASVARFDLGLDPSSYDHVIILGGAVNLGDAGLDVRVAFGFDPPVGTAYTLIGGASGITGTFHNLPEGAIFPVGTRRFQITYKGGSGHDVVITRLAAAPADLSIAKASSSATAAPGQSLTFTITVTNAGPNDAGFPSMSDTLPAGLEFQSVSGPAGWTCSYPTVGTQVAISCKANTIAKNTQAVFTVVAKVAASASGDITNTAAITSTADDAATTNNAASVTVRISSDAKPYRLIAPNVAKDGS